MTIDAVKFTISTIRLQLQVTWSELTQNVAFSAVKTHERQRENGRFLIKCGVRSRPIT